MKSEMISKCHLLNKFLLLNFNSYDGAIELFPSVVLLQISLVFEKQGSYASTYFI